MIIDIIKIGNSQGIRLPKTILEQCHIDSKVDLEIKDNRIIINPIKIVTVFMIIPFNGIVY